MNIPQEILKLKAEIKQIKEELRSNTDTYYPEVWRQEQAVIKFINDRKRK